MSRAAAYVGADGHLATRLEIIDGAYTGRIGGAVMYADEKTRQLTEYVARRGGRMEDVWSYGDHASDADLLSATGHPHATNASPALRRIAAQRGWPLLDLDDVPPRSDRGDRGAL